MKSIKIFLMTIVFTIVMCLSISFADVSISGDDESTIDTGSSQINQSSDWFSNDSSVSESDTEPSTSEFSVTPEFFAAAENVTYAVPSVLAFKNSAYFISIYGETDVVLSVLYSDPYNNIASTGYPKTSYWKTGGSTTTVALDFYGMSGASWIYQKQINLPVGEYQYCFVCKNDNMPLEYSLPVSSFVVTVRPAGVVGTNQSHTSNAKVTLNWSNAGSGLTYKLYFGEVSNNLSVLYTGASTCYDTINLEYNKTYYWQVEALDSYGVSSLSPVYSFSTITKRAKAFNYPNPFNPATGQKTNIVFDMPEDNGSAELKVYSEMGNLCWSTSVSGLSKGANEVSYDGRDDRGQMMYNGTYVCIIKKKYTGREDKDWVRLMIIK